jgi:Icc-related predicted phosphoesterase
MFNTISETDWFFPPTKNKNGKSMAKYDCKMIIIIETTLFAEPTIISSDLHNHTETVFNLLDEHIHLDQFLVLTVGDMASERPIYGCDGDPTPHYTFMSKKAKEFYFVQGNHDLPDPNGQEEIIKNNKNNNCKIKNTCCKIECGSIGGINGIISNKRHPYKITNDEYIKILTSILKRRLYILLTHDTPEIPVKYNDGNNYNGNKEIYTIVNKFKPKIHIYGHCHHPTYHNFINGVHYICADGRVLIMVPKKYDIDKLFKKPIQRLKKLK